MFCVAFHQSCLTSYTIFLTSLLNHPWSCWTKKLSLTYKMKFSKLTIFLLVCFFLISVEASSDIYSRNHLTGRPTFHFTEFFLIKRKIKQTTFTFGGSNSILILHLHSHLGTKCNTNQAIIHFQMQTLTTHMNFPHTKFRIIQASSFQKGHFMH